MKILIAEVCKQKIPQKQSSFLFPSTKVIFIWDKPDKPKAKLKVPCLEELSSDIPCLRKRSMSNILDLMAPKFWIILFVCLFKTAVLSSGLIRTLCSGEELRTGSAGTKVRCEACASGRGDCSPCHPFVFVNLF